MRGEPAEEHVHLSALEGPLEFGGVVDTVRVRAVEAEGLHQVGEVGEGVAQGGKLPVQDADDAGLGGVEDLRAR